MDGLNGLITQAEQEIETKEAQEEIVDETDVYIDVHKRSRMTIQIDDETATLHATIGTPDVEKIMPYTAVEVKDDVEHATFRGHAEMKISVIKAYTLDERPASNLISLQPKNLEPEKQVSKSTSSVVNPSEISLPKKESVAKTATYSEKQFFTPSTKLVLEEISSTIESKYVKRALPFSNKDMHTQKL
ncbi:hypothetical protein Tco_0170139 [Tanacetum coccineum]